MGNFNLKSIWKQTGGTGGSTNLEQRVQNIETNYFKKDGSAHQIVNSSADFFANIVLKRNGYVDHVDTNGATSMINKQYLEQQLTTTKNQIRTENNTFTGTNTFTSTGEVIKLNSGNNNSAYMAGYKSGNNRIWYFGKGSSSDDNFIIGSTANIKLEAASTIQCNNKKITQVADPVANTDAATKQYVDNKIQKRVYTTTNAQGNTHTIQPTNGYEIISVMVGRKRTSDNYYFFAHQANLNFQLFLDNDTYKLYTEGPVSGFGPDYKIIVVEKKI